MRRLRIVGALLIAVLTSFAFVGTASAQGGPGPTQPFTLQPGASATISFEGFCAQFGEPFPAAVGAPNGLADPPLRVALGYAQQQGLTGSDQDALQVQYALWQLLGETDAPNGGQLTQDVLSRARGPAAPQAPQGTSLIEALQAGQVQVTVDSFAPVGNEVEIAPGVSDNFYGRGQLTVTNSSQQALTLYMPIGTIIPSTDPQEQDLVAYATGIQADAAANAQATSAPTTAATTAATTAPTAAATAVATTAATTAPTVAATTAPTVAATAAPTSAPTAQPTSRPATQLPQTAGSAPFPLATLIFGSLWLAVVVVIVARRRRH